MDYSKESLKAHYAWNGKIEVVSRVRIQTREDLALAYTPGVAAPCLEIKEDESKSYELTRKNNLVGVITDGTAVLGLGDIGPSAAMPVMEGKCILFKEFANVDAFPLCIDTKNVDEFVNTVKLLSKSFGGINLEDIAAPRCFEIETRLKELCDIPVFHDDQHGTAIVVAAALINACRLFNKNIDELKVVVNGAGSAGIACSKLLLDMGVKELILCDKKGIIRENDFEANKWQLDIAKRGNISDMDGDLSKALIGADVFLGVSAGNILNEKMIKAMNKEPFVFAMANPIPEIMPDKAKAAGAAVVGTGRSDFPNQINNVLAFPGVFRGVLDARKTSITEEMKIAAAYAIADVLKKEELTPDNILPEPLNKKVAGVVAKAMNI